MSNKNMKKDIVDEKELETDKFGQMILVYYIIQID